MPGRLTPNWIRHFCPGPHGDVVGLGVPADVEVRCFHLEDLAGLELDAAVLANATVEEMALFDLEPMLVEMPALETFP